MQPSSSSGVRGRRVIAVLVLFALGTAVSPAQAQQTPLRHTVSGYVEDAASGERLAGANVYVPGAGAGASTNDYGFFSLPLPADSVHALFM